MTGQVFCQNGTFKEEVRLEEHRLCGNLLGQQERVCFLLMRYGAQGSLDTLSCELGALPRTAPLYALLPWVMGTAQETTSRLTPAEAAMTTPGQKLKKL